MMIPRSLAALALLAACAHAQPAPAPAFLPPEVGPYIQRRDPLAWRLQVTVDVYNTIGPQSRHPNEQGSSFPFEMMSVVFPIVESTSSATTDIRAITSTLSFEGRPVVEGAFRSPSPGQKPAPQLLQGQMNGALYHSGTYLGKWAVEGGGSPRHVKLNMQIPATCSRVVFDEQAAMGVPWPTRWPEEALSTLQPQMFIDFASPPQGGESVMYDMKPVRDLAARWAGGDPRSMPPVLLAKRLAGELVTRLRIQGRGWAFNRKSQGFTEGLELRGAAATARTMEGTEFDAVCLLAAVYRQAGLPCRLVIGFDQGPVEGEFVEPALYPKPWSLQYDALIAWVEFALFDEARNTLNWVPVDVVRMRRLASRPPPIERAWPFFGTNEQLRHVVPFAFHFHPPTTVRSYGSPAFWGWVLWPQTPRLALQSLNIDITSGTVRASPLPAYPRNP